MKPIRLLASGLVISALLAASATAGPVSDFEKQMRGAYSSYRAALFTTNSSKAEDAAKAMASFRQSWGALAATYSVAPPHYADDSRFGETLAAVAATAEKASTEIASGKLGEAHETLEGIRDQIGQMHERNGIIGFSDRMNAYHAEMEHLLGLAPKLDAATLPVVGEKLGVLAYLAGEVQRLPPTEAATDPSFKALSQDVEKSIAAVRSALATGDVAAVKTALGGLKAPYSKLFLKFG